MSHPHLLSRRQALTTGGLAAAASVGAVASCSDQTAPNQAPPAGSAPTRTSHQPAPSVPTCSQLSATPTPIGESGMHLVTLGTKGGPSVRTDRAQPPTSWSSTGTRTSSTAVRA